MSDLHRFDDCLQTGDVFRGAAGAERKIPDNAIDGLKVVVMEFEFHDEIFWQVYLRAEFRPRRVSLIEHTDVFIDGYPEPAIR